MAFDLGAHLRALRTRLGAGGGRLLILTHDNPDPDSLAAALGLRKLLEANEIRSVIALGGIIGRAENRAMVRELKLDLVPFAQLDLDQFAGFALVDTQPGTGNNSLPADRKCDIVIDHHPLRATTPAVPWRDIRPEVGATATIVYNYLKEAGIALDAQLITAFLYALKSETRDLGREAGNQERDAYIELMREADFARLHAISNPKLGREHFVAVDRALRAAVCWSELLAINLGALDYPDLVAEVADLMLPYDKARWVLCVGQHHNIVYLSMRTDRSNGSAGSLIRRVVGARGAAGGHGMVAGGRLFAEVRDDEALKTVYDDLVARLCGELKISAAPTPLL
ncbi:MAG TPA: DHH family phosphoesterase [Polyangia bacterium]|jgi:nanoRNase/pAp phosphatase (c-di-AMP/oligoRNAs hydrolase)